VFAEFVKAARNSCRLQIQLEITKWQKENKSRTKDAGRGGCLREQGLGRGPVNNHARKEAAEEIWRSAAGRPWAERNIAAKAEQKMGRSNAAKQNKHGGIARGSRSRHISRKMREQYVRENPTEGDLYRSRNWICARS